MTTADTTGRVKTPQADNPFRLPDPPEREPEDMTSAKHLAETGNMHHLKLHLGNPETTIVKSELYLALGRRGSGAEFRVPDLLIAFEANPELYERNNGYVVSEQGKPPEFVLEIASPSTRAEDNAGKRDFYARHEVVEYWRFDEEDRPNRVRLAGDRLAGGHYEPIAVEELDDGVLQGYSAALNLHLRWGAGGTALARPGDRPPHSDLRRPACPRRQRTEPRRSRTRRPHGSRRPGRGGRGSRRGGRSGTAAAARGLSNRPSRTR